MDESEIEEKQREIDQKERRLAIHRAIAPSIARWHQLADRADWRIRQLGDPARLVRIYEARQSALFKVAELHQAVRLTDAAEDALDALNAALEDDLGALAGEGVATS